MAILSKRTMTEVIRAHYQEAGMRAFFIDLAGGGMHGEDDLTGIPVIRRKRSYALQESINRGGPYVFEARRLRELILGNRDDPKHGAAPLQALAGLDPHRPGYSEQLLRLADQHRDSLLYDNLIVRWANTETDREQRAARLLGCVQRFPTGDALPEALYQLADLEMHAFGSDEARRAAGLERLRDLATRFGQTCWGQLAAERLRMTGLRSGNVARSTVSP